MYKLFIFNTILLFPSYNVSFLYYVILCMILKPAAKGSAHIRSKVSVSTSRKCQKMKYVDNKKGIVMTELKFSPTFHSASDNYYL